MELRPFQLQALTSLQNNAHTLLVAPTGSGKSLIFQKYLSKNAAKIKAILVSPLNALARQHGEALRTLGLNVHLGVGTRGEGPPSGPGVWVVNPERLKAHEHRGLKTWRPHFLVVDEAHCIWEWGEGFRPEFKRVLHLVGDLSIAKSFWCTATLPSSARKQIRNSFAHAGEATLHEIGNFALPEHLQIERKHLSFAQRLFYLKSFCEWNAPRSGIIFVSTRQSAENLARYFELWNIRAFTYHAGMSQEERLILEKSLQTHALHHQQVMVIATSAFGMGMDYSFLEFCILFQPSFNLLALAQAVGRVGRSSRSANAVVLWHEDDFLQYRWLTQGSAKREEELKRVEEWCKTSECPRAYLQKYFNDEAL